MDAARGLTRIAVQYGRRLEDIHRRQFDDRERALMGSPNLTVVPAIVTSTSALAAGTVTAGLVTGTTAGAMATAASGGVSPIAEQWYRSTALGTLGTAVPGQTTTTLSDTGLTASTTYYYTLVYTDSTTPTPSTRNSNQVALTTSASSPSAALANSRRVRGLGRHRIA